MWPIGGPEEGPVKARDVVDPIEAEELAGACRPRAHPRKVGSLHRNPVVDGEAPVLSGGRAVVRRGAHAEVRAE